MGLTDGVLARVRAYVNDPGQADDAEVLDTVLRGVARWRSQILANSLGAVYGRKVLGGPFAGMDYPANASEGALLPRLIGCYESELHPHLAALAQEGLDRIVDVGCAEGYYAVGLARLMPGATVHAFDIDPVARRDCALMAAANGVADRVLIGETFTGEDFARFAGARTLVFMDIEGHERILLDPDRWPALRSVKIVVETHPGPTFALTEEIAARFAASHTVIRVDQASKAPDLPPWMRSRSHLDQILATWEWRRYPTPWLVMRPKPAA
ncbi:MAG TPA: hypothetical protein VL358_00690 [Caulobacteraceae bacterium]|jgi:hypothetical protein|nr:hypothetical protein [Caulobacteraceae bacterium]